MQKLRSCHRDLQRIAIAAIRKSEVDFGISEGYRTVERQQELFNAGKSQIDGIKKKGKHNYKPSMAFDLFAYHSHRPTRKKIMYDTATLCYIAGVIRACAEDLLQRGQVSHRLRWGGNWDKDGVLLYDQSFDDLVHFEIV